MASVSPISKLRRAPPDQPRNPGPSNPAPRSSKMPRSRLPGRASPEPRCWVTLIFTMPSGTVNEV
ncbi:hypothetical protein [Alistipes finegoldii]|uniref:hypothetical protein n=1 Tax=Alistipes finegoldii TaxID=214856 RepID=UPI0012DE1E80|nr:hypothetical protein [Alistipes finegoldii]